MKVDKSGPTPVRGEDAPALSVESSKVLSAGAKALSQPEMLVDLDHYLKVLAKNDAKQLPGSLARIKPPKKGGSAAFSKAISDSLVSSLAIMSSIYADGFVTEHEMVSLGKVSRQLGDVLALREDGAFEMLSKPMRQRLEHLLFSPLEGLIKSAKADNHEVLRALEHRDLAAFSERISGPTKFETVNLDAVLSAGEGASLQHSGRYGNGDVLLVARSDGSTVLGVVVGREPEGDLRVEVAAGESLAFRTVDETALRATNPLKIGDYIADFEGKEFWVKASAQGALRGASRDTQTGAVAELDAKAVRALARRLDKATRAARAEGRSTLGFGSGPVPAAKTKSKAESKAGAKTEAALMLRAGGAETPKVQTLERASAQGGLFTNRGPNKKEHGVEYAKYNEDAALLGVVKGPKGDVWVAGAFDQAGGMGKIPGQTGAASRIAAEHLLDVAAQVAKGASPKTALKEAVEKAHADVRALNEQHGVEAITTVASGVVVGSRAFVVNTGDSQVYQYSKNGKLKAMTLAHNLGDEMIRKTGDVNSGLKVANIVTSALGIEGEAPKIDLYEWKLAPGDYLVFVSDGVSDANYYAQLAAHKTKKKWTQSGGDKVAEDLGQLLKKGPSAEAATEAIRDYALSQMKNDLGKPDNTTVVVFQPK